MLFKLCLAIGLAGFGSSAQAVVGGTIHPLGLPLFPSSIAIRRNCTAAKVGERSFLTAAHCVMDNATGGWIPMFFPDSKIDITNNPLPAFGAGFVTVTVEEVLIDPSYQWACTSLPCDNAKMRAAGPDVALLIIKDLTPWIPIASIDFIDVPDRTRIKVGGFGCEDYASGSVRVPSDTVTWPDGRLKFDSTVSRDASLPVSVGNSPSGPDYFYTVGPALDSARAGLWKGDSGGPVYYDDGTNTTILGVNSTAVPETYNPGLSGFAFHAHASLKKTRPWILSSIK